MVACIMWKVLCISRQIKSKALAQSIHVLHFYIVVFLLGQRHLTENIYFVSIK